MPDLRVERARRTRSLDVGSTRLEVTVASIAARVTWVTVAGLGSLGFAASTPVAVQGGTGGRARVPWFAGGFAGLVPALLAARTAEDLTDRREQPEEDGMAELERVGSLVGGAARPDEIVKALKRAASGDGAVGPVTTAGERSVVPLLETTFSGGYGGGGGTGTSGPDRSEEGVGGGGGGGGFGRSRPVAVVEVAPDGVTIRPVIDKTALALAAITSAVSVLAALTRRRRR